LGPVRVAEGSSYHSREHCLGALTLRPPTIQSVLIAIHSGKHDHRILEDRMSTIKLASTRAEFRREVDSARRLRDALQSVTARNIQHGLAKSYVDQAIGLAFVGLVDAWEHFAEESIIKYFAGARSTVAPHPVVHRYLSPRDIGEARDLLYLLEKEKKFLAIGYYTDLARVSAKIFAANNPYTGLAHATKQIEYAKRIRNRVAHASSDALEQFKQVARTHRGLAPNAKLPKGYNPGRLLVSPATTALFLLPSGRALGPTVFDEYLTLYVEYAAAIVP
jgi:hypothetical protein